MVAAEAPVSQKQKVLGIKKQTGDLVESLSLLQINARATI